MLGLRLQKRRGAGPPQALSNQERRFARGTRTLADLLAPAAVEIARNHVRLEYQYARVLVVVGITFYALGSASRARVSEPSA